MENTKCKIVADQNPEDIESESSGSALVGTGGAIGLTNYIDVIVNQLNEGVDLEQIGI